MVNRLLAGVRLGTIHCNCRGIDRVFWAFSTTLIVKPIAKVTNNAGFTIAHNQMLGLWFFSKFAHKFGDPEKHDAENLKLPGWLAIFNHNVTAIAIVMTLFVGGFLLATGIDNVQLMAKGKPGISISSIWACNSLCIWSSCCRACG